MATSPFEVDPSLMLQASPLDDPSQRVENSTAFLNDITGSAFLVNVDYFTAPITQDEFNSIKQQVNLDVLRLMEKMGLSIAGSSTDVRVTNLMSAESPANGGSPAPAPASANQPAAPATSAAPGSPAAGGSPAPAPASASKT